jgi:hypothetical protein
MKLVIHNKCKGLLSKGVHLLHNNACLQFVTVVTEAVGKLKYELPPNSPWSQGLAQSHYQLFGQITEALHGQIFASVDEVTDAEHMALNRT